MHPSDHVALAFVAGRGTTTSSEFARALDWTRIHAAARLRGLERAGLAQAELGEGGQFRLTTTAEGMTLLSQLSAGD